MVCGSMHWLYIQKYFRRDWPGNSAPESILAAPDVWHRSCHHGHELNIGLQRQSSHIENGVDYVLNIECRLGFHCSVCLQGACRHARRHIGGSIADIDLPTGNIE